MSLGGDWVAFEVRRWAWQPEGAPVAVVAVESDSRWALGRETFGGATDGMGPNFHPAPGCGLDGDWSVANLSARRPDRKGKTTAPDTRPDAGTASGHQGIIKHMHMY